MKLIGKVFGSGDKKEDTKETEEEEDEIEVVKEKPKQEEKEKPTEEDEESKNEIVAIEKPNEDYQLATKKRTKEDIIAERKLMMEAEQRLEDDRQAKLQKESDKQKALEKKLESELENQPKARIPEEQTKQIQELQQKQTTDSELNKLIPSLTPVDNAIEYEKPPEEEKKEEIDYPEETEQELFSTPDAYKYFSRLEEYSINRAKQGGTKKEIRFNCESLMKQMLMNYENEIEDIKAVENENNEYLALQTGEYDDEMFDYLMKITNKRAETRVEKFKERCNEIIENAIEKYQFYDDDNKPVAQLANELEGDDKNEIQLMESEQNSEEENEIEYMEEKQPEPIQEEVNEKPVQEEVHHEQPTKRPYINENAIMLLQSCYDTFKYETNQLQEEANQKLQELRDKYQNIYESEEERENYIKELSDYILIYNDKYHDIAREYFEANTSIHDEYPSIIYYMKENPEYYLDNGIVQDLETAKPFELFDIEAGHYEHPNEEYNNRKSQIEAETYGVEQEIALKILENVFNNTFAA